MAAGDLALNILINGNAGGANAAIQSVGFSLSTLVSSPLGPVVAALSAFAAIGDTIVGIGQQAVQMAADFQQSQTLLVTSAGESRKNLQLVTDGIEAMSVQTATSAMDLSSAMFLVESSGYRGAAGLAVLQAAAEGAKIENANLQGVTDALTTTMHDFREPASQAVDVMNSFREAASIGKMRMDDFTGAMRNVGPIAALAKIHLTDIEAALSTMSLEGDKGAAAGTHLAQSLLNMISPSTKAQKVLKEIGMTAQQVSDDMQKSLPDTLAIITDAIGKKFPAGSEAYNHALSDMFGGTRGLKAILELTGTNLKDFTADAKMLGPIMNENAKAVGGWADVQGNFNFQMDAAKMAVNTLMLKIGSALLPVLGQLFQAVTPTIVAFTQWIDKSKILQDIAKTLSGWIGYVGDAFNQVFNPIKETGDVLKPLTDSFDRATSLIKPLKEALIPLGDTFDRAKGIIASTSAAVQPLADSFDRATSLIKPLNKEVLATPNAWVPFWTAVKNLRDQIMKIDWGAVGKGIQNIANAIGKMDWGKVGKFFTDLGNSIKNIDWGKVGKSIQDIAIGLTKVDWGKVGQAFVQVGTAVANIDWVKVGEGIKNITEGLSKVNWGLIMGGINTAINGIMAIPNLFGWVYDVLLGHSIIPDIINGIIAWFTSLPGKLSGIITGTVSNIVSWFAQLPGRTMSAISSLAGQLSGFFSGIASSAVSWGANIVQGIINGIGSMFGALGNKMNDLVGFIGSFLPHSPAKRGELSHLNEYGPALVMGIASGITRTQPLLHSTMSNLVSPMGGLVKSGNAFALSGNAGNVFALGNGGQTIVIQVQPAKADITMDHRKVGEGTMRYVQKEIRIQGNIKNK